MMQYFSIKKKSVPIVLPGQNILIGTKHIDRDKTYWARKEIFHQNKIFSPEQNFFTGTKFFRRNKIFHSGSIQYGCRQPTKVVFAFFGASGKGNTSFERKSASWSGKKNEWTIKACWDTKTETKTQKISEELGNDWSPNTAHQWGY